MDLTSTIQTIRNQISTWFEPFQNPPSGGGPSGSSKGPSGSSKGPSGSSKSPSSTVESTKHAITTFYTLWNKVPNEFPKTPDISTILSKWSPYTSAKAPYILPTFATLDDQTYQTIQTAFSNAYVFAIIDTYTALQKRHTTKAPSPLPKPQTVPKDTKADRLLASKGDASIQSFYTNSYYPSLYTSIRTQVSNVFKIIEVVLSKSSQEERDAADRLLPKRKEDQSEIQKKAQPLQHILPLSELYAMYIVRAKQYLPGGEKYATVEFEYRNTLQSRLDKFLAYFYENALRDTDTPVAKSGVQIPVELAKLPTSLSLRSKSLMELLQIQSSYFGAKGLESKANALMAEAFLENRRDSVESLLRTFHQTYTSLSVYCNPADFPKEVQDANTILPTYWKEIRQKGFSDLPLGKEADRTAKEIGSLYSLEGRFLTAYKSLVGFILSSFAKTAAEKAGYRREWNPHPSLASAIATPFKLPTRLDVSALSDVRDTYLQLWMYMDKAVRAQLESQYSVYSQLIEFSQILDITVEKHPFPSAKPLYELASEYETLDRVGTQALETIKQRFSQAIEEYSKLYARFEVFQSNPDLQNLVSLQSIRDVLGSNTSSNDTEAIQAYTFYTIKLVKLLYDIHNKYIAEPSGNLARLQTFIRNECMKVIEAFKARWDSYGVPPYPTYEVDRKSVMTPITTSQLESLMDRYSNYVQKTQDMEGLQEFSASLQNLRESYELFGKLYNPNKSWLPTSLPPEIQQAVDTYEADAEPIRDTKSMSVLSTLLNRYTKATRALWLFFNSFVPSTYFDPYQMLLVEYEVYKACRQLSKEAPVGSIEKERLLFQSFVEPNATFNTWIDQFRSTIVEKSYPSLLSFLKNDLELYASAANTTVYTSTPYEIRDSLHDISVHFASQNLIETKSRVFQLVSRFLNMHKQGVADELHSNTPTTLDQIRLTDDTNFVLVQEAKYRSAILEIEGKEDIRSLLETMDAEELRMAHIAFQKATGVPDLSEKGQGLQAFEDQLRSYASAFWQRFTDSTSRTRDILLINLQPEVPIVHGKRAVLQQSKKYAQWTVLLAVAEQQETTLTVIDHFKDRLYIPYLKVIPDRPIHLAKLALNSDSARWKCKAKLTDTSENEISKRMEELKDIQQKYISAVQEWLQLLRSTLLANLNMFSQLYDTYVEFDTKYSDIYDLEPLPSSFSVRVKEDIAFVEQMSPDYSYPLETRLNEIRTLYYFFPETSQFPTFVRFIKSQVYRYLQTYVAEFDKLELAIQPTRLPIAALQSRVSPAIYTSVGNLQDLLDVIQQLKKGTDALRVAMALQAKKESTRKLLDSLDELIAYSREQIGKVPKLDVNIPQLRIDLQYAERKENIDEKYERISSAFAVLATESLRSFNTEYNKNIQLRPYFYRNAVEVLNAFTLHFTQDVESVGTNVPYENEQIARQYIDYTKIVQDAQPAAAVVQDTTEKYRRDTVQLIQRVQATAELLSDIKEIQKFALDISGAMTVVETASFVHEMEPTRKAYDVHYKEQYTAVQDYATQAIRTWKSLFESFVPFTKWLPANQQAIAERSETPADKSIDVALNLARKYIRYRTELLRYTVPNGTFFSKVRLDVQNTTDTYMEHTRLVSDLSGAPVKTLENQKSVQTASLEELKQLYTDISGAEKDLLDYVSSFTIRVLQNQFLENNKTLLIPEYAVARDRAVFLLPLLERRAISIESVVVDLQYYISLIGRIDVSLQRVKVLQLLDAIEKDIDDIELEAPDAVIDIPTQEQLDVERSRIGAISKAIELEKVQSVYVSYRNRIQSQFNAWIEGSLKEFEKLYQEVQKDGTLMEYDRKFVSAYTQLDTIRAEIGKGVSIQRRAEIRSYYANTLAKAKTLRATLQSRKEVETQSMWREQQTKRMETSAAMQRFLEAYQTYPLAYPARFRKAIRETTADLDRIQKSTVRTELDTLLRKYTQLMREISEFIAEEQAKRTEATAVLLSRFKTLYLLHSSNIQAFPSYLQIDVRMIHRDMATLQGLPDATIVDGVNRQYVGYMDALTKFLGEKGIVVGSEVQSKKQELRGLISELNTLFLANTAVFDDFPVEVQRKIRSVAGDVKYIENPTVARDELDTMVEEYKKVLRLLRQSLHEIKRDADNTALLPSLKKLQDMFRTGYESVDSTRIPLSEVPFFQGLMRGLDNPTLPADAEKAIAAYTQGLRKLATLPKTAERRIENGPFDSLQEVMGYFQNEYKIRDVRKFIPADRLLLTGLRNDAAAYLNLYRTPPPNMRNYVEIVDQVAKQYWDGLRILRTYPLI